MDDKFERQTSFGWLVNVVAHHAAKQLEVELAKHDFPRSLWPTMMCLWEKEGITQREIAQISKVENSTTTRTIDKLESLGLVERRADPNSRRSYNIYLTDEGRTLKETLQPVAVTVNKDLLSALEPDEQTQLIHLLNKMMPSK
ncbi:MarR family transcriptional regulator [Photobacterium jeanii]|uniref:MarR family transcriptional regulator n=1 Tax=Photobacterium jeanii TaxID=858640 RepID=A0A178K3U9_9GAMM|nr:MarR family transcriptional regulator [Photobacterium jeanii]OAN11434.1 MarR family transcriptional regulator [Photobacterium jeanii]PST90954.1 MarR family transcriptional regulator [Photobacterium jeanii]